MAIFVVRMSNPPMKCVEPMSKKKQTTTYTTLQQLHSRKQQLSSTHMCEMQSHDGTVTAQTRLLENRYIQKSQASAA